MNYSLEYLIELSKRTGDRLIVHDSVMGEAFVIMPLESYESFLNEKRSFLADDEFEPESDADVLNRINAELAVWRDRQNEEAIAEWTDSKDSDEDLECEECEDEDCECGDGEGDDEDEIDTDEEPMYHEIIEENPSMRRRDIVPNLEVEEPRKETPEVFEIEPEVSEVRKLVEFSENPVSEDAPWEKFKKMGAPLDPGELNSIPETTDFSGVDFGGELVDVNPVFLEEPIE